MTINLSFLTGCMAEKLINGDEITVVAQIKVLTFVLIDISIDFFILYQSIKKNKCHNHHMVYNGGFTIANIYHNIPAVPPIGDGKTTVVCQIMVEVFDFFDRSIKIYFLSIH